MLLAAVFFGTNGTAQALGPEGSSAMSVSIVRVLGGGAILAVFAAISWRRTEHPKLTVRSIWMFIAIAALFAAYQPLFFAGTIRNGVAMGTVIALGSAPVLAGIVEWALTRKRPTRVWMLATLAAMIGVALLSFGGTVGQQRDMVGVAASVGAGACFAALANIQRRLLTEGWGSTITIGVPVAIAGVLMLPFIPSTDFSWVASSAGVLTSLWLAVITIAVAWLLFTWGLGGLSASTAATLTLAEPLTAGLLGVFLLQERLTPMALVGIALVFGALAVIALASGRRDRQGEPERSDPEPFAIEG